jgi:hypothetical protein
MVALRRDSGMSALRRDSGMSVHACGHATRQMRALARAHARTVALAGGSAGDSQRTYRRPNSACRGGDGGFLVTITLAEIALDSACGPLTTMKAT